MNNDSNNNLIYVKVDEVAEAKGVTIRAVQRACQRNKYITRYIHGTFGRGGKQYEILLSSVEPELQTKILSKLNIETHTPQGVDSSLGGDFKAPVLLETYPVLDEGTNDIQNNNLSTLFSSNTAVVPFIEDRKMQNPVVPNRARKLALAKVDLVNHWEAYRNNSKSKSQADSDFMLAYNSQILCKNLYQIMGECSVKSLQRWRKDLKEANNDYTALIPNYNYGSESSYNTRISQLEQNMINDLMLRPNKLSVGNAYRLINFVLKNKGISQTTSLASYKRYIENFKRNHNDVWTYIRGGAKALNDKVSPFIIRDKSKLKVGDVLVADGHVLDFQIQNPFTGRPCRATMVCYQDFYSSDIAGFDIMLTENTQCVASALRNSIIRLGKMPKIAYQDNGRSFKNKFFNGVVNLEECGFYGLFGNLGIIPVFTKPYHGQSKPIERFFREFTQTCASLVVSYVGNNIENKPAYLVRNELIHKAIHDNYIPTIEEAIDIVNSWLEFYRSQPCPEDRSKTIGEVFDAGTGDGVDTTRLDDLMMAHQIRKIGRNGVKMFGNYYFSEELYGIKDKVVVKYSLTNIFEVKVYSMRGKFICKANAIKEIHPFAAQLGDANDMATFKHAIAEQRKLEKLTLSKVKQILPRVGKKILEWQEVKQIGTIKSKVVATRKAVDKYEKINLENIEFIEDKSPKDRYQINI